MAVCSAGSLSTELGASLLACLRQQPCLHGSVAGISVDLSSESEPPSNREIGLEREIKELRAMLLEERRAREELGLELKELREMLRLERAERQTGAGLRERILLEELTEINKLRECYSEEQRTREDQVEMLMLEHAELQGQMADSREIMKKFVSAESRRDAAMVDVGARMDRLGVSIATAARVCADAQRSAAAAHDEAMDVKVAVLETSRHQVQQHSDLEYMRGLIVQQLESLYGRARRTSWRLRWLYTTGGIEWNAAWPDPVE